MSKKVSEKSFRERSDRGVDGVTGCRRCQVCDIAMLKGPAVETGVTVETCVRSDVIKTVSLC